MSDDSHSSGNIIPISDEQAKLGQEVVKTLRQLGGFLGKALGSTPEDLIAYLGGDWLRIRRAENLARMISEAKERLEERGVGGKTEPATLTLALPLMQAAADESREEIRDLWARLLAAAMDPGRSQKVRRLYIDIVGKMDPLDALVLKKLEDESSWQPTKRDAFAKMLDVGSTEVEVSFLNLIKLDVIADSGATKLTNPILTSVGRELLRVLRD